MYVLVCVLCERDREQGGGVGAVRQLFKANKQAGRKSDKLTKKETKKEEMGEKERREVGAEGELHLSAVTL